MPHFYGTRVSDQRISVSYYFSDQTGTHLRRQTRYHHYVRTVRLISLLPGPSASSFLHPEQKPCFKRILRESRSPASPSGYVQNKPSGDRVLVTTGATRGSSQPLIPRNHLQDSLVSFPCFQPRRSFTPQRHLIGCAPWPVYYTGCQNTFSPFVILPAPIQKNLPPLTSPSSACRRHLYPRAASGQRVCVLVSQSGRPNEMHNGIVATRRVSRSKRRFSVAWRFWRAV